MVSRTRMQRAEWKGHPADLGLGVQPVLSATTDRVWGESVFPSCSFSDPLASCLGETQLGTREQGSWDVKYLGQPLGHRVDGRRLSVSLLGTKRRNQTWSS